MIHELAALGFSNVLDFIDPETGSARPLHEIPRARASAVKKFDVEEKLDGAGNVISRRTRLELLPKEGALEKIGKHLGMFQDGRMPAGSGGLQDEAAQHDGSISPARRLAMLVMAAMRRAQETGMLEEDANG